MISLSLALDALASRRPWRRLIKVAFQALFGIVSFALAIGIVYSQGFWHWSSRTLLAGTVLIAIQLITEVATGGFAGRWRYVGVRDAATVVRSAIVAGGAGIIVLDRLGLINAPLRVVGTDTAFFILLSSSLRLGVRWVHESARRLSARSGTALRRAVVIGGGDAGATLIKSILATPKLLMDVVAVVDDDRDKKGTRLHGAPIAGSTADLALICDKYRADEIIIAIPSASRDQIGDVVDACVSTHLPFRIAPDPEVLLNGHQAEPAVIRVLQPNDLLGRPQVDLDLGALRAEFAGARIAITGAAGSIGSELTRQAVKLNPAVIYLIDRNENDLYFLCAELDRKGVSAAHVEVIQDIRDRQRMTRVLTQLGPTHVFHAAAFKHVPLMESHLVEAVENNILGTWSTLEAAREAGVGKFVLISTDKAVRPTSVMGATKRFVELLVAESTREMAMRNVVVRFGNVLGSNGSAVPLFQRQIAEGGPVTVTSRDATRYFMTPTEAAQLVLQAAALPESGGKIAILEMGRPIRIWDLAEQLVRMNGLRPGVDIEIKETALRPGEKLHEELWWATESAVPSSHPKIMLADVGEIPGGTLAFIPVLQALVAAEDDLGLREILEDTVGLTTNGNRRTVVHARAQRNSASTGDARSLGVS